MPSHKYISLFTILLLLWCISASAQTANFSPSPSDGCAPLAVSFGNTSSGFTSYSWTISVPNGTAVASTIPNSANSYSAGWTFHNPGVYTITLTAGNASGNVTKTATVTVHPNPDINFSASPVPACPGDDVILSSSSTTGGDPSVYTWYTGTGIPSSVTGTGLSSTTVKYNTGPANVSLQIKNKWGCTKTKTIQNLVTLYPAITADFNADKITFCEPTTGPNTANFTATASGGTSPYTYTWDFGPGSATGQTASNTFAGGAPKSYTVTLTVQDAKGCKKVVTKTGYINVSKVIASFTGPTSVCIGDNATFTNTSTVSGGGGTNSTWTDGGSITYVGSPFTYFAGTAGTVRIKLSAGNSLGCVDTTSKLLTVRPQPVIDFTSEPVHPCPAPATVTFKPTPNNLSTYTWDFGGPSPNTGTSSGTPPTNGSISHTYPNGDFTVKLIATDQYGCKDTIEKINHIRVYDLELMIDQDKAGDCLPAKINFKGMLSTRGGLNNYPYAPGTVYEWDFGESSTSKITTTNQSTSWTYTTLGTFRVILKATTPNGCIVYDTSEVRTGPKPTANFSAVGEKGDRDVCSGERVFFTNLSTNYLGSDWTMGDGNSYQYTNPTHIYDSVYSSFTVTLIVNNNECRDTMIKTNYITVRPPQAKFEIKYHCDDPKKVTVINKTKRFNSNQWAFRSTSSILATNTARDSVVYTFPTLGTYSVKLIAINDTFQCEDSIVKSVELFDPIVSYSPARSQICLNDTTLLKGKVVGGDVERYSWYVDDAQIPLTPALINYSHQFTTRGYHKIKFLIEDTHGCFDSAVSTSVLVSRPIPEFGADPRLACVPVSVLFSDSSKATTGTYITTRKWDFGNGNKTTTSNSTTTNAYLSRGSYAVKLIVSDNIGCIDSILKNPYIEGLKPIAGYTVSRSAACIGETLAFTTAGQNAKRSEWDFGDGFTDTGLLRGHQYWATGKYPIRIIVTDSAGCKDTLVQPNAIEITKPSAGKIGLSDSFTTCPPLPVVLSTGTMVGVVESWWIVPMQSAPIYNVPPTASYTDLFKDPGYHIVKLVVKDVNGCMDTATASVDVLGYAGSLSYTPLSGCAPHEVNFTSLVKNVARLTWDFSDGVVLPGNGTTITHTYLVPGAYVPKLIITDNSGCSAGSIGKDTIRVDGVYTDFETSPTCEGYYVKFTDKSYGAFSPIQHREWTFEDGSKTTVPIAVRYYPKKGTYPIRLIATNKNGCIDTLDKEITIHPLPEISAGSDTVICLKDAAQLMGTGGVSYEWSPAINLSCTNCPNPLASVTQKTIYTVIGTDANKCSDTDQVEVNIKTKVMAAVAEGGDLCVDEKLQLWVKGGREYIWSPSDGLDNDKSATPVATPRSDIKYKVVSYEASCIPDTDYVDVKVHPKPTVKATGEATIIAGNNTTLIAQGERISRFKWAPTEPLNCSDCPNPVAKPFKTTDFTITAFTEYNCQDSDKVTITVLCDESQVFIPNTFTPNGDGQNDVFYPRGNGIEKVKSFRIYNRWGEIVYQRSEFAMNDAAHAWDGTFRGRQLPPDVFVYIVEAYCSNGEIFSWKGDVTLIR